VAEHDGTGARLLVVDDNKVNRLLLSRLLEQQGYRVETAENGRVALERLHADPPDLVLLDIEMPELDGYGLLERIRGDLALRDLPVIVTSSLEGLDGIVRCIELGAEDYLTKPVNPTLLRARLRASLEKKRLRDQQKALVRRLATPEVAQATAASGFALGGTRVRASVLFTDIRGFTPLSETQAPEETIELLNDWYALMFDAVSGHGGIVSQIQGDGLMAIFGAPQPRPDHARAAVETGLEMVELVAMYNAGRKPSGAPALRIGVGIATGEMVAGFIGTMERAIYTCIGDTVNLASRLEQHTKEVERTVLIDVATRDALGPGIDVETLGAASIRGKAKAVEVYAVKASG
jgi:class 3 adenylate cyclase